MIANFVFPLIYQALSTSRVMAVMVKISGGWAACEPER
jgi:hypothetical protein